MPRRTIRTQRGLTLAEAFEILNVDQLRERVALLPTSEPPKRKAEFVAAIEQHLEGERLHTLWERLDELQQKAVAETLYAPDGEFNGERFGAKYGDMPDMGTRKRSWGSGVKPSLLRLFLYSGERYRDYATVIPAELRQRLLRFVPKPEEPTLATVEEPLETYALEEKHYSLAEDDEGMVVVMGKRAYLAPRKQPIMETTVRQIPIERRETERAACQDLQTVLRLIERGRVSVSDKTLQPSAASAKEIAGVLRDGDFYAIEPKAKPWHQEIGPIKAFAWPLLVQAGRLAELQGKKLALTRAGRKALGMPPAETLRATWQRWLKSNLLDEFNRVDAIKGQRGKGKRGMTAVAGRREVAVAALEQCPVGRWVAFDDFLRFMQASNLVFEVTRDPWQLYISDANYGNLGGQGGDAWWWLEGRYLLCLLLEYAATLGLIDVTYIDPRGARQDFRDLWGADDLDCLSRYDGLLYFRLNALGAFCLGLTPAYEPTDIEPRGALTVLPSLRIQSTGEPLSPDETLLLDTYADQEAPEVWRLSRVKAIAAAETGHPMAELRAFLSSRDDQPLPETVESFLVSTERQAQALVQKGMALLIECVDAEVAEQVAQHELTASLCRRAGECHLVVDVGAEEAFRKALRTLGYGMPRV